MFLDNIVKHHGVPESIVSDRDARFTSRFWSELNRALNTKLLISTSFHPQTDGATERANRTISQILCSLVKNSQHDWSKKLPLVELAINSSVNSTSKFTPFELNYGRIPKFSQLLNDSSRSTSEGVRNYLEHAKWSTLEAHDNIINHRILTEQFANRHRRSSPQYQEGQLVYSINSLQLLLI